MALGRWVRIDWWGRGGVWTPWGIPLCVTQPSETLGWAVYLLMDVFCFFWLACVGC